LGRRHCYPERHLRLRLQRISAGSRRRRLRHRCPRELCGGIPSAQAFQYDLGLHGYRITQYPTDGGTIIAASTDNAWHQFAVTVSGTSYAVQLDNVTVTSGTTGVTCGGVFLRQWSGTSEFRDLVIAPAS
jgi:hypothetical protein